MRFVGAGTATYVAVYFVNLLWNLTNVLQFLCILHNYFSQIVLRNRPHEYWAWRIHLNRDFYPTFLVVNMSMTS